MKFESWSQSEFRLKMDPVIERLDLVYKNRTVHFIITGCVMCTQTFRSTRNFYHLRYNKSHLDPNFLRGGDFNFKKSGFSFHWEFEREALIIRKSWKNHTPSYAIIHHHLKVRTVCRVRFENPVFRSDLYKI